MRMNTHYTTRTLAPGAALLPLCILVQCPLVNDWLRALNKSLMTPMPIVLGKHKL